MKTFEGMISEVAELEELCEKKVKVIKAVMVGGKPKKVKKFTCDGNAEKYDSNAKKCVKMDSKEKANKKKASKKRVKTMQKVRKTAKFQNKQKKMDKFKIAKGLKSAPEEE
jgi:uncharacterized membrane protein YgaE (UPF0421/DUF939 family)